MELKPLTMICESSVMAVIFMLVLLRLLNALQFCYHALNYE